jgi:hypothetical protein
MHWRSVWQVGSSTQYIFCGSQISFGGQVFGPPGVQGMTMVQRPWPMSPPTQRTFVPMQFASVMHCSGMQLFISQISPIGQVPSPRQRVTQSPLGVHWKRTAGMPQSIAVLQGSRQTPRMQCSPVGHAVPVEEQVSGAPQWPRTQISLLPGGQSLSAVHAWGGAATHLLPWQRLAPQLVTTWQTWPGPQLVLVLVLEVATHWLPVPGTQTFC